VCREADEAFSRRSHAGTAAELAERLVEPPKGEITLVIGPAPPHDVDEAAALAAVAELGRGGPAAEARGRARRPATGAARNRLYRGSL